MRFEALLAAGGRYFHQKTTGVAHTINMFNFLLQQTI